MEYFIHVPSGYCLTVIVRSAVISFHPENRLFSSSRCVLPIAELVIKYLSDQKQQPDLVDGHTKADVNLAYVSLDRPLSSSIVSRSGSRSGSDCLGRKGIHSKRPIVRADQGKSDVTKSTFRSF